MSKKAEKTAKELLDVIPLIMRSLQSDMRQAKHLSSPAHYGILFMLTDGGRNLGEMAKLMRVSSPTMSNSVSKLVEQGLLQRTRSGEDRRRVVIELTTAGEETLASLRDKMEGHLKAPLLALDDAQLNQLLDAFAVLRSAFSSSLFEEENQDAP